LCYAFWLLTFLQINSFDATKDGRYFASTDGTSDGEGLVYELLPDGDGTFQSQLWFDVGAEVFASTGRDIDNSAYIFGGLRSIEFHPDFEENGKLYVSMMEQIPADKSGHTYLGPIYESGQAGCSSHCSGTKRQSGFCALPTKRRLSCPAHVQKSSNHSPIHQKSPGF
jgi:hypothetical protein